MLTRRQRLELWIAALLCLLVGLVALWIYAILREPSPTRTAGPHRPRLPESAPVVSELPDEITPEIAPAAIPIRIFCFDGNGRPARPDRVRITVGDETASLGDQGTIDLGPRERPARAAGRFEVAEEDGSEPMAVEFEGLVTGAGRSSGPVIDPRTGTMLEPLVVPAAPRRLVWSFVLPVEEEAPADRFSISIDTVLVEEWLGGARVWVDGSSTLPDGASIDTNLVFDGQRAASSFASARVAGGRWRSILALPQETRLFSGSYLLGATFNLRLENVGTMEAWPEEVVEALAEADEIVCERRIRLGDPEEARREDLLVEEYYREALRRARQWQRALIGRMEDILLVGRGWDPAILLAHEEAHSAWFREPLVTADGLLAESRWRRFLDEDWRPAVASALDRHRARSLVKYREAESRFDGLLSSLLGLSQLYSMLRVYPLFGLPPHPSDEYMAGGDAAGDLALLEARVDDNFEGLARFLVLVPDEISSGGDDPESAESREGDAETAGDQEASSAEGERPEAEETEHDQDGDRRRRAPRF